jgi:hypothetical protein
MTVQEFAESADLYDKTNLEKALLFTYFHFKTTDVTEFKPSDLEEWFQTLHLPNPNTSRLLQRIRRSGDFVKGSKERSFRLHSRAIRRLDSEYDGLEEPSEEVESFDTIIPSALYENTRGYVERLARQINASYENNIFDGCAVLMRRLTEVLLILTYKNLECEDQIKRGARHVGMKKIIDDAVKNQTLDLTTDSKNCVDGFRKLGNFSAHKIHYNCRRQYIQELIPEYRALIEELLHKADLM